MSMNPSDSIRDAILRELYSVHQRAKSPRSAAVGIRDLQSALKRGHGFKQQEVASNLDYLIQKGWAVEVIEQRTFMTKGGTQQSAPKVTYKISDVGIDRLERASVFEHTQKHASINITNVNGVTIVGDGNVVNTEFADAAKQLGDLKQQIEESSELSDDDRLNTLADIEALQAQLQKPTPNREVISILWGGIQAIATVGGFSDACRGVAAALGSLLGG